MNQQEFQQRLHKLSPELRTRLLNEQQELHNKELFVGKIPEQMPRYRQFVMMHVSEASMDISIKYWDFMFRGNNDAYCMTDIITFLSAAQLRTFREWLNTIPYTPEKAPMAVSEWVEFKTAVAEMEAVVNPIVEKNFNTLFDKMMRIQHLDVSGQSNSIPFHKRS